MQNVKISVYTYFFVEEAQSFGRFLKGPLLPIETLITVNNYNKLGYSYTVLEKTPHLHLEIVLME